MSTAQKAYPNLSGIKKCWRFRSENRVSQYQNHIIIVINKCQKGFIDTFRVDITLLFSIIMNIIYWQYVCVFQCLPSDHSCNCNKSRTRMRKKIARSASLEAPYHGAVLCEG